MPIKRRQNKRREDLSEEAEQWLRGKSDGLGFFPYSLTDQEFADLWAEHSERVVAEHVAEFPGTRPYRWWQYDAPRIAVGTYPDCHYDGKLMEPRNRLGGVGTPCHESLACVPSFSYGLPNGWVSEPDVEDPPTFESQAAYLERHGLFLEGERKRLRKQDFEPEAVVSA
jgi:hypothetical protein